MAVLNRYILAQVAKPMLATLLVALLVLLAERMLRVVDLVIGWRGSLLAVLEMLGYLVPHYMGLALPAAFFIGILIVVSRMSREGELDAMMAAGSGLPQLVRPLALASLLIAVANLALIGFLQPYSRYAYRATVQAVTNASFLTLMREGVFTTVERTTAMVQTASPDRRDFTHVFIYSQATNGDEVAITAEHGRLRDVSATRQLTIDMTHGVQQVVPAERPQESDPVPAALTMRFGTFETTIGDRRGEELAPRGEDERELTLPELVALRDTPPEGVEPHEIDAELWGRVVRILSIPVLPFLAVPLARGRRRSQRSYGLALGLAALIAYNQVIGFGESVVDDGQAGALLALGVPYVLFVLLAGWIFVRAAFRVPRASGSGMLDAAFERLAALLPAPLRRALGAS
ncbi:MAG: LptF/LptG family permease [Geminicoccaceae bacterium]